MTGQAKTVLVTGGAHRIGAAIAKALAEDGYGVAIHYLASSARAEALAADIAKGGARAVTVAADLTREDETASLVARASEALGAPVGVLVNNASVFARDEWDTTTRESWDAHMETNLRAPFALTQAFARGLGADGEGAVINILDQRVKNLTPHFTSYTLSKSALWTLTRTLALALAPRVRVNAIGPGPTLPSPRQTEDQFRTQAAATPLRRAVPLDDIVHAARFLLAARSVTGQMIAVDSGQHLNWAPSHTGGPPEE